jgi:hypothetical protein
VKHGRGKEKFRNGDVYEGQYTNGRQNGFGSLISLNGGIYEGNFCNGLKHG